MASEDRRGAVPCTDSGDSIGNGIDYRVWTWRFFFSVCMCSDRHDCVQPILTDKTNVWLELWGHDACWIALLSILNDSW